MGPDTNQFSGCSPIDWALIARACSYYTSLGYQQVEVPWAVPSEIAEATMPPDASHFRIHGRDTDLVLVGSAEQGFLHLACHKDGPKLGKMYFSVSPCFRGEVAYIRGVLQPVFMKLELFALEQTPKNSESYKGLYHILMDDAQMFMNREGVPVTSLQISENSHDLVHHSMELGSYGTRSFNQVSWAYGTGLAEPRFSCYRDDLNRKRKNWHWNVNS